MQSHTSYSFRYAHTDMMVVAESGSSCSTVKSFNWQQRTSAPRTASCSSADIPNLNESLSSFTVSQHRQGSANTSNKYPRKCERLGQCGRPRAHYLFKALVLNSLFSCRGSGGSCTHKACTHGTATKHLQLTTCTLGQAKQIHDRIGQDACAGLAMFVHDCRMWHWSALCPQLIMSAGHS